MHARSYSEAVCQADAQSHQEQLIRDAIRQALAVFDAEFWQKGVE